MTIKTIVITIKTIFMTIKTIVKTIKTIVQSRSQGFHVRTRREIRKPWSGPVNFAF
jgi:hypothetical protein